MATLERWRHWSGGDIGAVATLERWRAEALSRPARERAWTAAARLEAVIATAAMDEAQRLVPREGGFPLGPRAVARERDGGAGAARGDTRTDRRRIKELEKDLRRKEKALAETTALLVLKKKLQAIFLPGGDE